MKNNNNSSKNNRQQEVISLYHKSNRRALVFLLLSYCFQSTTAETYTGNIGIGCTNGTCTISGTCNDNEDSLVPGNATDVGDGTYENIYGEIYLSPTTCIAECDENCIPIVGSDTAENDCIGSAGYVYCPETQECIRPWLDNCPFDGTVWDGPINITVSYLT
jgi:hypothetical protein